MGYLKLFAFIFLNLINLVALVKSQDHDCLNNGSYTRNSTYKTNLDKFLSSVSSNIDRNGFYHASMGENSDRVNAIVLCRGDVQLDACRTCVDNAITSVLQLCPNQKQAILWNEVCMIRYSNESIFGIPAAYPRLRPPTILFVPNQDQFTKELNRLLESLRPRAASGGSLKKIAAGNLTGPDFMRIYALVQCTPDITRQDCQVCLTQIGLDILGATGDRVLAPSCNLRYGTTPFFNDTRIETINLQETTPPPPSDDEMSSAEFLKYDFGTIRAATNFFSDDNKLGEGGFGTVYQGKLSNGNQIAVKRLSMNSGQGDLEFKNEVSLVAKLQHRNLVRILGFSVEGSERILVYEFVQNGSLDHFIFDPIMSPHLDWDKRYKIIGGVARGLLYLHEDSQLRIIHRDLKASNILLDGEMNPKISDFGMAKLFVQDQTQGNTGKIVGTYGYMSPEYAMHGHISVKLDVFSFGILVLEIISGQRTNNFRIGDNAEDLPSCAWKNWREGTAENIVDPTLRESPGSLRDIVRCIHISLLCVQENAADRPTMASVVLMLTNFSVTVQVLRSLHFLCIITSISSTIQDY
ncbi:Cysteine-rich receptor-like protein kinase 10 [Abeliophyllum distichum]|uniref:Cysteine-rich receptor-like protein kinase 10 n=1 Tax=Abeliophyllum distichum TaxID=126358 RepID=A0ABD1PU86_9LAMI